MGCHMINSLFTYFKPTKGQNGIVLWLVHTTTLKDQTINAFRDQMNVCARSLKQAFNDNYKIFTLEEAFEITPEDVENNVCIIVATLQSFKKSQSNTLRTFADSEKLSRHFNNIPMNKLIMQDKTIVNRSFVNVMRLWKPFVILDEAHHTETRLSYEILDIFNADFILQLTATPKDVSNVLIKITAQSLKDENMIKIPINIDNSARWQDAVEKSIQKRDELQQCANTEINVDMRPLVLLQAELDNKENNPNRVTTGMIRSHLLELGINHKKIAIKTGSIDELKGVNLYDRHCVIEFIITVKALEEGWDNSFAYIVVSAANVNSEISAKQLVGRVLRQHKQKKMNDDRLNQSYVFVASTKFEEILASIKNEMKAMGYLESMVRDGNTITEYQKNADVDDHDIRIPCIAINDRGQIRRILTQIDLFGDNLLELDDIGTPNILKYTYNQENSASIDINDKGLLIIDKKISDYFPRNYIEDELKRELIKNIIIKTSRDDTIAHERKIFAENTVNKALENNSIIDLWENSSDFYRTVIEYFENKLADKTKEQFMMLYKSRLFNIEKYYIFPESTLIYNDQTHYTHYKKHLYMGIPEMNSEERLVADELEKSDTVWWWCRNKEVAGYFFLQGWKKNKFYPDFIVRLKNKSKSYVIIEYKGKHLQENVDTLYKNQLGEYWSLITGNKFIMVNRNEIQNIRNKLSRIN